MFRDMFVRYKSIVSYLFFGVCTTAVNFIIYYFCAYYLHISVEISTAIAWFLAVVFAYVTNKKWVFESKLWKKSVIISEAIPFLLCRLATGAIDLAIMFVGVEIMGHNDLTIKMFSNILVIILNYIASKMVIFKKKR